MRGGRAPTLHGRRQETCTRFWWECTKEEDDMEDEAQMGEWDQNVRETGLGSVE
jgi:hypothetical protein